MVVPPERATGLGRVKVLAGSAWSIIQNLSGTLVVDQGGDPDDVAGWSVKFASGEEKRVAAMRDRLSSASAAYAALAAVLDTALAAQEANARRGQDQDRVGTG